MSISGSPVSIPDIGSREIGGLPLGESPPSLGGIDIGFIDLVL